MPVETDEKKWLSHTWLVFISSEDYDTGEMREKIW